MNQKINVVRAVRESLGENQQEFADRLGVGLRSLRRYEAENTLPQNQAVRRNLEGLAKKQGIEY